MESSLLRTRPLWKSTRPDDPAGVKLPAAIRNGRLRFEVLTPLKAVTVDALIVEEGEVSDDEVKRKLESYAAETEGSGLIDMIVILSKSSDGQLSPCLYCLSLVQMLYAGEYCLFIAY
jgi:hypothetical protein